MISGLGRLKNTWHLAKTVDMLHIKLLGPDTILVGALHVISLDCHRQRLNGPDFRRLQSL